MRYDGDDYEHERDEARLDGQLARVWSVVRDGKWRSLKEIAGTTGDPEASVSAQLRHLRKPRFGGHKVEKTYSGGGLYLYRVAA